MLEQIRVAQDQAHGIPPLAAPLLGDSSRAWGALHALAERSYVIIRGDLVAISRTGRHALYSRRPAGVRGLEQPR